MRDEQWRRNIGEAVKRAHAEGRVKRSACTDPTHSKKQGSDGGWRCHDCQKLWWRQRDRPKRVRTGERYRLKYGITMEEVQALLAGTCALCDERPATVIDHDHETGQIRGGVCRRCNVGLILMDDPVLFAKARRYIARSRKESA